MFSGRVRTMPGAPRRLTTECGKHVAHVTGHDRFIPAAVGGETWLVQATTPRQSRSRIRPSRRLVLIVPAGEPNAVAQRTAEQLREALDSRAIIDQAKGILMALRQISAEEAFALLVEQSQRENVKVREVAVRFIALTTGATPAS